MASSTAMNGGDSTSVAGLLARVGGVEMGAAAFVGLVTMALSLLLLLINRFLQPQMDIREPYLVKPKIPLIGHIIGIIRHQSDYHRIIHQENQTHGIVTLPMLNQRLYAIYDPYLVQAVLRNKIASFESFELEFTKNVFGLSKETFAKITLPVIEDFTDAIHASFKPEPLRRMNEAFLKNVAVTLDRISSSHRVASTAKAKTLRETPTPEGVEIGNLFLWCRDLMTLATTDALYGDSNPFSGKDALIQDLWDFEGSIPFFLISPLPRLTIRRAYQARSNLKKLMTKYYAQSADIKDATTSEIVLNRANALRRHGIRGEEIGQMEIILPNVATLNAVPIFYWLMLYILHRPALVDILRTQIMSILSMSTADDEVRTATIDMSQVDAKVPLLVSCYQETMRLTNYSVSVRRLTDDISLPATDGRTYLLKKGADVQLPAGITHRQQDVWGDTVHDFDPERFLTLQSSADGGSARSVGDRETGRKKKAAYIPFGGGRHLCPGRNFAFAEITGLMSALLVGYDFEPLGMKFGEMKHKGPQLASGAIRPVDGGSGLGCRIVRRKGWEDVQWKFKC